MADDPEEEGDEVTLNSDKITEIIDESIKTTLNRCTCSFACALPIPYSHVFLKRFSQQKTVPKSRHRGRTPHCALILISWTQAYCCTAKMTIYVLIVYGNLQNAIRHVTVFGTFAAPRQTA